MAKSRCRKCWSQESDDASFVRCDLQKKSSKKHDEVQISPVAGDFCRSCLLKEIGTGCNWLDEMK